MSHSVLLQCMCWEVGGGWGIRDGSECVVTMHVLGGGGWVGRDGSVCCYNACVGRWRVGGERWVSLSLQCMYWEVEGGWGEMGQCVVTMHVLGGGGWVGRDGSVCCYNACAGEVAFLPLPPSMSCWYHLTIKLLFYI